MEILQGVSQDRLHAQLKAYLDPFLYYKSIPYEWFEDASEIYRLCRKKGITISKSVDCLIAANALHHGDEIFHKDRDFTLMTKVFKELKVTIL